MLKKIKQTPKRAVALMIAVMMLLGTVLIPISSQLSARAEAGDDNESLRITGIGEQITYGDSCVENAKAGIPNAFVLGTTGGKGDGPVIFSFETPTDIAHFCEYTNTLTVRSVGEFTIVATRAVCGDCGDNGDYCDCDDNGDCDNYCDCDDNGECNRQESASIAVRVEQKPVGIVVEIDNRPFNFTREAKIASAELDLADIVPGDEYYVELVKSWISEPSVPSVTFASIYEGEGIAVEFEGEFVLSGKRGGNYRPVPVETVGNITVGIEPGEGYNIKPGNNGGGWTGLPFAVEAEAGYSVSLRRTEGGKWHDDRAVPTSGVWQDRIEFNYGTLGDSITFYVRRDEKEGVSEALFSQGNVYRIDNTAPVVTWFEFTQINGTPLHRVLNFLSFGLFFNEQIQVTITASDAYPSSGFAAIRMYAYPDGGDRYPVNPVSYNLAEPAEGTAVFRLPVGFRGTVGAVAIDNAGNKSADTGATIDNSDIELAFIQTENIAPTIDFTYPPAVYTDNSGRAWHVDDIPITIAVRDDSSGIRSAEVSINGTIIQTDINGRDISADFFARQTPTHEEVFVINTSQGTHIDGYLRIDVTVVDNAGNSSSAYKVVYRDTENPVIEAFEFSPAGMQYADGQNTTAEVTDYGFYFMGSTTVTISARDDAPSAGIRSITYYTVCVVSGRSAERTVNTVNDRISFVIPADFKGQIFARATDTVDNEPDYFVNPSSVIIASPERHAAQGYIVFNRPATSFTDNTGLDLYAADVNVGVRVVETFAGLRSVEWSVVSPNDTGNNQSGGVSISNSGFLSEDTDGWSILNTDRNLVTEMSRTFMVRNNSNDIALWVRITDRAGNTSEDTIRFSIDKTAPTIAVTYNNNSPDGVHRNYFNAERVATIVVTERNFRAQDVDISITNAGGPVPSLSSWTTAANSADSDSATHTATITFSADGVYTFDISYSDNAGNAAAPFGRDNFTIDQTDPVISVSFDNNSAENINHFGAGRIATISITERNFDERRVIVTGTAIYAGAPTAFPALGEWSSDGDVRTAAINFGTDGLYAFRVAFTDMAGNTAEAYTAGEFYIDISPPDLVETHNTAHHEAVSVHNLPAEQDSPRPLVFSDTNISHIMYTITAQVYAEGDEHDGIAIFKMDYMEVFSDRRAEEYTITLPPEFFNVNGVYEIRATAFDLAGNSSGEAVHTYVVMRDVDMMAYIPSSTLALFNGIHKQAVNFPDIVINIFVIDNMEFDISIGEIQLIGGDYEEEITKRVNGVVQHEITIPNTFIARTFYGDDQVYILPINVSKNPMRTVGYIIINNVPPSGMFDPALGLRSGIGFYGIGEQEIRIVNLSDGIDEGATTVTVNGASVPFGFDADAGTISFVLERSSAYGHPWAGHDIRATLIDTAGNEFTLEEITNIYVGSWFMRYWIFFAIGGAVIAGGGGLAAGLWLRRKKKIAD